MISFERAKVLLNQQASASATGEALREAIATGTAAPISTTPGIGSAHELARDFGIRKVSAARSGREVAGIDDVLNTLKACPDDTAVIIFHFRDTRDIFSLFLHDAEESVLGVIRVTLPTE